MNTIALPCRADLPRYAFRIELDGKVYAFSFDYNDREGAWFMSISDDADAAIVTGVRVITGTPLLDFLVSQKTRLPPGLLYVVDTENGGEDPGQNDLGLRHKLVYMPVSEITEALAAGRIARLS